MSKIKIYKKKKKRYLNLCTVPYCMWEKGRLSLEWSYARARPNQDQIWEIMKARGSTKCGSSAVPRFTVLLLIAFKWAVPHCPHLEALIKYIWWDQNFVLQLFLVSVAKIDVTLCLVKLLLKIQHHRTLDAVNSTPKKSRCAIFVCHSSMGQTVTQCKTSFRKKIQEIGIEIL